MPNKKIYSPKLAKQIADLLAEDKKTITEICSLLGISRSVFYKWKDEHRQMHSLISRTEKIVRLKKMQELTFESQKGLLKLLRGFEITTVKQTTKYLQDGSTRVIVEYTTKHIPPDTQLIKFVLTAKDSKNFKSRVQRLVNIRFKTINKEAQKEGRILSDNEPRPESFANIITPLTNLQSKSSEPNE